MKFLKEGKIKQMAKALKCNISLEQLEKYRDKDGFLNLDVLNLNFTEDSREKVGKENRLKNWVDFSGTEVLLKGESEDVFLDEKQNGAIYSELIIEELAKQIGLPCAYYDLIKINGKKGTLSKKMFKDDKTDLISLYSLIGDTKFYEDYPEMSEYLEVEDKLYSILKQEEIKEEEIISIIKDYRKQMAFFIMTCSIDKHTENVSFFSYINPENKKRKLELSCIYDNENSLLLDTSLQTLEKILKNGLGLQKVVNMLDPKIAVLDGDYNSVWKNTLDVLLEDDEVYDFILDAYENLNVEKALKNVENKIKAPLPNVVKLTSKYVFEFRKKEIEKIIYPEIEETLLGKQYSEQIATRAMEEEIRKGEEDDMLRKIMKIYGIDEKSNER